MYTSIECSVDVLRFEVRLFLGGCAMDVLVLQLAGIVTGIGLVHGREVLFVANDATVKGARSVWWTSCQDIAEKAPTFGRVRSMLRANSWMFRFGRGTTPTSILQAMRLVPTFGWFTTSFVR